MRSLADTLRYAGGNQERVEQEAEALAYAAAQLRASIIIVMEALDLRSSLAQFIEGYKAHAEKAGVVEFFDGDDDLPYNEALSFLQDQLSLLAPLVEAPSGEESQVLILRNILQQSDWLIHQSGKPPKKEKDVQDALQTPLRLAFPDCTRQVSIVQVSKAYEPDFGIESIRTAIEVKYVNDDPHVGIAIGQLYEDMKGYAGAPQWAHFEALIYQTAPFTTQMFVDAELKKVGAPKDWVVHVVTGVAATK